MTDLTLDQLAVELHKEATGDAMRKVDNIIKRSGVEMREHWKAAATKFPSGADRKYPYSINFPGITHGATTAEVTVGSDDPTLAVIETGGAHHTPHNYGAAALEYGATFAADAMRLMGPLGKR